MFTFTTQFSNGKFEATDPTGPQFGRGIGYDGARAYKRLRNLTDVTGGTLPHHKAWKIFGLLGFWNTPDETYEGLSLTISEEFILNEEGSSYPPPVGSAAPYGYNTQHSLYYGRLRLSWSRVVSRWRLRRQPERPAGSIEFRGTGHLYFDDPEGEIRGFIYSSNFTLPGSDNDIIFTFQSSTPRRFVSIDEFPVNNPQLKGEWLDFLPLRGV